VGLTTLGVGALVTGLELLGSGAQAATAVVLLLLSAAFLAGAAHWMRRRGPGALFDLSVFRVHTFRATQTGGLAYRVAVTSIPFLLPLLFQDGFGWDPVHAGALVTAVFIGNIAIKPATTPLIRRFGFKPLLVLAAAGSALTFVACAALGPGTPDAVIVALLALSGALRSLGFSAYMNVQYADVSAGQLASANAAANTLVQLAHALGVAVGALFIRLGAGLLPAAHGSADPYRAALLAVAALMLLSVLDSLFLPRHAGTSVSGRAAGTVKA